MADSASMIRLIAAAALLAAAGCSDTLVDFGGRMSDQASVQTYEEPAQPPPAGSVPVDGGEAKFKESPEGSLKNPVPEGKESAGLGRVVYGRACIQCHGENYDGEGTVGRSFKPLPSDLRSEAVRSMSDDRLFRIISYGSGRCPPLFSTITPLQRWRLVRFLRTLSSKEALEGGDGNGR